VYACIKSSQTEFEDELMMMELDFKFTVPPVCLYEMAGVALSGTALLAAVAAIIPAFGFAEGGVEAESAAAAWQATFPNVEKESLFATLQSLGARGQLLSILKQGLPLAGTLAVASGAFCSKLEDIKRSSTRAAEDIANMTSAVFEQIERAERDGRALEQIRKAADESIETSKDALDKAYNTTNEAIRRAWGTMTSGLAPTSSRSLTVRAAPGLRAMALAVSVALIVRLYD
jgi:Interferon-induced 6-16 family